MVVVGGGGGLRQQHFNRTSFKSLMVRFHNDSLMKFKVVEDEERVSCTTKYS